MTRKTKTYLFVVGGAFLLLVGIPLWFIFGPPRRLVISPETTVLTEPLTADGQVDYVTAVIEQQRVGVTQDNNAAIPLLRATWPCELEPNEQQIVCEELGIEPPQKDGLNKLDYDDARLERITAWASEKWGVDLTDEAEFDFNPYDHIEEATSHPWSRAQIPPLAEWIDDHADSFALLHQMEDRDHFFCPSPSLFVAGRSLASTVGPDVVVMRTAARALSTRAMMHIGEGKPQLAWRDLRLLFVMTRLPCVERHMVYTLVACAVNGIACQGLEQLLNSGQCDRALLEEIDRFFTALPPIADPAIIVDQYERWMLLEMVVRENHEEWFSLLFVDPDRPQGPKWLLSLPIDKNATLRRMNQRIDEMAAIIAIQDPLQMKLAGKQFDDQLQQAVNDWGDLGPTAAATISQSVRGIYAADLMASWLMTAYPQAKLAQFRCNTTERMLRVAVALEKFRLEGGEYPDSLSQLSGQLDVRLLIDPYAAGRQFRYERRDKGYLLLSVFENELDDGGDSISGEILNGEWVGEDEERSNWPDVDLVLRFPMPPLVLTKPKTRAEVEAEFDWLYGDEGGNEEEMLEEMEEAYPVE
ncbi:hypothetical protein LOC68_16070 [Blastopirellula sp. JC732]|uniref:Uncharacterized protein n=1 Tax=Blastopirellula sediminis TaxID=2894196 RepID=A0A9X1SGZ4_9BACT|nr:hypothetical protein [Blastopirellula sediminis]MCC9606795.1 hypothetical protein [Blastopirellula sediminis]MCC9629908.1 hypothetical protein [Blastopirellula sediminis]